jgi:hypothetical protein
MDSQSLRFLLFSIVTLFLASVIKFLLKMSTSPPSPASNSFDPLRCAALHNRIVSFIASDAIEHHNNRLVHNFFVAYGENASRVRSRLSPPVVAFLENIDILIGDTVQETANFCPHLSMPEPRALWSYNGGIALENDPEKHENWVILYCGKQFIIFL